MKRSDSFQHFLMIYLLSISIKHIINFTVYLKKFSLSRQSMKLYLAGSPMFLISLLFYFFIFQDRAHHTRPSRSSSSLTIITLFDQFKFLELLINIRFFKYWKVKYHFYKIKKKYKKKKYLNIFNWIWVENI